MLQLASYKTGENPLSSLDSLEIYWTVQYIY